MMGTGGAGSSSTFGDFHHDKYYMVSSSGTDGGTGGDPAGGGTPTTFGTHAIMSSIICNLATLKEKVQQVQSTVNAVIFPEQGSQDHQSTAMTVASMPTLLQEIVIVASSVLFACQKMTQRLDIHMSTQNGSDGLNNSTQGKACENMNNIFMRGEAAADDRPLVFSTIDGVLLHQASNNLEQGSTEMGDQEDNLQHGLVTDQDDPLHHFGTDENCDMIIELDAADLLAKYTHYCQVCGKGFKRDANLRMHMRAHGDEYKSKAALSNPGKSSSGSSSSSKDVMAGMLISNDSPRRKYSCPQEGCRWNKKHTKFQPLKSMICVKNHYKRSHCPKMYICNRCSRKEFSLLSDLRTHEKHCGEYKWQCSCGTTFSRKDKLMGHVAMFVGHSVKS